LEAAASPYGAGNIWVVITQTRLYFFEREMAEDCCSERVGGALDTGDVVVFS
jgi:hypothetical protein